MWCERTPHPTSFTVNVYNKNVHHLFNFFCCVKLSEDSVTLGHPVNKVKIRVGKVRTSFFLGQGSGPGEFYPEVASFPTLNFLFGPGPALQNTLTSSNSD